MAALYIRFFREHRKTAQFEGNFADIARSADPHLRELIKPSAKRDRSSDAGTCSRSSAHAGWSTPPDPCRTSATFGTCGKYWSVAALALKGHESLRVSLRRPGQRLQLRTRACHPTIPAAWRASRLSVGISATCDQMQRIDFRHLELSASELLFVVGHYWLWAREVANIAVSTPRHPDTALWINELTRTTPTHRRALDRLSAARARSSGRQVSRRTLGWVARNVS